MDNINETRQWYIVNTYSGHENKVAENLRRTVESLNLGSVIFDVIVAEQDEPEKDKKTGLQKVGKDGKPKFKKKNLYPGYIFVEMIMTEDSWYIVRNTPGVTGIAGSSGGGQKPNPVSREEMEPVLKRMGRVDNTMYSRYNVGDLVRVINGPLAGSEGKIISIDKTTGVCRIETTFFGRSTPTDVDFADIERV
ncbi:MAG: transcription termination/antitermination protein NusG [Bacilli bacterium]|nr:transcription termination/antitermination protein NusG [Bacilli bacterium]